MSFGKHGPKPRLGERHLPPAGAARLVQGPGDPRGSGRPLGGRSPVVPAGGAVLSYHPQMAPEHPQRGATRTRRRLRLGVSALYFALPIAVYAFSSIPGVNRLTPFLALVAIALLVILRFLPSVPRMARVVLWTLLVLALVGSSGWFFSPFFFALYLLAIGLGFLYTPVTAVAFTLALLALFVGSIGEVNPTADFLTLLSLLSVIPITIVLRRSFLLVQQEKRGILILEEEGGPSGVTSLDAILTNTVNRVGILLRQPLTYLKQGLALLEEGKLTSRELPEVVSRMRRSTDELFTLVKEFESGTTKNLLLGRQGEKTPPT